MRAISKNLLSFYAFVLASVLLQACSTPEEIKRLMAMNKKISAVSGVMSSTINISTFHDKNKNVVTYAINARVATLPTGSIDSSKVVHDIIDSILLNESKVDSFDYLKVSLMVETKMVIVHAQKGISVSNTPSAWRELVGWTVQKP